MLWYNYVEWDLYNRPFIWVYLQLEASCCACIAPTPYFHVGSKK